MRNQTKTHRQRLIESLLLNTNLIGFRFESAARRLVMDFESDRYIRGVAKPPPVRVTVLDVRALAYTLDVPMEVRPSQMGRLPRFSRGDLVYAPAAPEWSSFVFDTAGVGMRRSPGEVHETLLGTERAYRGSPHRTWLHLSSHTTSRGHYVCPGFVVGGHELRIESNGRRLGASTWFRQNEEFWRRDDPEWPSDAEIARIQRQNAAKRRRLRLHAYRPPPEPVWRVGASKAPEAIVRPVRKWFEVKFARDWLSLAKLEPGALPERAQAERLQRGWLWDWPYAREIGQWWIEGDRAYLSVFGVEHNAPDADSPAHDHTSVWYFGLIRRGSTWIISGVSHGRPRDDHSPLPPGSEVWLKDWPRVER